MRCNCSTIGFVIFLSLIVVSGSAFAEVSVVMDDRGNYAGTNLIFSKHKGRTLYWEPVRPGVPSYQMLNIAGDMIGDGKPSVAENPLNGLPWAAWSHFNGEHYEILISRWDGLVWTPAERLFSGAYDDFEPTIAFDASGIPFIAFTRSSRALRIFITSFRDGKWIEPVPLSDQAVKCSSPMLLFKDQIAVVAFLTPSGICIIPLDEIVFDTNDIEEGPNPLPEFIPGSGNGGMGGGFQENPER